MSGWLGEAVQVDSIKTRVESAPGFSARNSNVMNRFQTLLSNSTCAATVWAKANGCTWDDTICTFAAEGGHLEALQWARAHGCPWSAETCARAAMGGHLAGGVLRTGTGPTLNHFLRLPDTSPNHVSSCAVSTVPRHNAAALLSQF